MLYDPANTADGPGGNSHTQPDRYNLSLGLFRHTLLHLCACCLYRIQEDFATSLPHHSRYHSSRGASGGGKRKPGGSTSSRGGDAEESTPTSTSDDQQLSGYSRPRYSIADQSNPAHKYPIHKGV